MSALARPLVTRPDSSLSGALVSSGVTVVGFDWLATMRSAAGFDRVVTAVPASPENPMAVDSALPCEGWTARDVVDRNHRALAAAGRMR
jgi:hypothetical protein